MADNLQQENKRLEFVYRNAYNFLLAKVGADILKRPLDRFSSCKAQSFQDVFKRMIESLKNRQGYVNFIAGIEKMNDILFDFQADKVLVEYSDWQTLCLKFKDKFGSKYKIDPAKPRNSWAIFSRGIMDSAKFLSNFKNLEDFQKFIGAFLSQKNEFLIAALPMLLDKEIFGFGFALACDFLKEIGYTEYAKPDVHIRDIFIELGLVETGASDYEVFKKVVKTAIAVKEEPAIVDKIFWLIGSGNFNDSNLKIGRHKAAFISKMKEEMLSLVV